MKLEVEIYTMQKLQYSLFFSYRDANVQYSYTVACTQGGTEKNRATKIT